MRILKCSKPPTLSARALAIVLAALSKSLLAVPPDHLNVGGLGELVLTTIETDAPAYLSEVTSCGDLDGDGLDDLLIRVHLAETAPGEGDAVVVVYGSRAPAKSIDPVRDDVRKTMIRTGAVRDRGAQIAGGEDIDGDGLADFVAASGFEETVGGPARLVVLGSASLSEEIEVPQIGAEIRGAVIFDSAATDPTDILGGELVALSPDINGDGYGEILVVETARLFDKKRCFVILGDENLPPRIDLVEVGASVAGFVAVAPDDMAPDGRRGLGGLTSLGDVNGDGLADLGFVVKNIKNHPPGGFFDESFIVFGRALFPELLTLGDLPAGFGVRLPRYQALARGGDIDGDGVEDVVMFHEIDPLGDGQAHVLYGRESFPEVIDRDAFRSQRLGVSVSEPKCLNDCDAPAGAPALSLSRGKDLDGDGRSDLLLGASQRGLAYGGSVLGYAGAAFLLRGGDDLPETISTNDIARGPGVRIDGIDPQGRLGTEVFMLDDFDGDGVGDIVLTSRSDPCSDASRKVWIVSGQAFRQPPARISLIQPAQGWIDGGNLVTVFGTGFDDTPRVHFGSREAEVRAVLGSGILIAAVPSAETAGEVPVRLTTGGGREAAGELRYTYRGAKSAPLMLDEGDGRTIVLRHFESGYPVLGAATGDFNGDTRGDVVILDAWWIDHSSWEFHIVFGSGRRAPDLELEFLREPDGVTLEGSRSELGVPSGLAAGGDIDGDGFDDFVARFDPDGRPEWRVILGRPTFPVGVRLSELPRTIRFVGAHLDSPEQVAAIVPDVSGDGLDELLIATRPRLYVVKGRESFRGDVSLDDIAARGEGAVYDTDDIRLSTVASSAGDFNGDGALDVLFAGFGRTSSGAVVILYGGADMFPGREVRLEESLLRDTGGLLLTGRVRGGGGGASFFATVPGDLDGDGLSEVFLNQDNWSGCTFFPNSGEGFVLSRETVVREGFSEEENPSLARVYGNSPLGVPDFALSARPGETQEGVLYLESTVPDEMIGVTASPAGDFNGDGYGDLLIGSAGTSAYVVFGSPDLLTGPPVNVTQGDERVMVLESVEVDRVASRVSGGFDWDGDGVDDILLGTEEGVSAGRVHVVFGIAELPPERPFIRGDSDASGAVNLSDAVLILAYLFSGLAAPPCLDALDVNDDGSVNLSDAGAILLHLFSGGSEPPPPFPGAGSDPTADELTCTG